jgi:hypothetical protein
MAKRKEAKPKQGAASRGLQLVGLLPGNATAEEVKAFADALIEASQKAKLERAVPRKRPKRVAKAKPASAPPLAKKPAARKKKATGKDSG